MNGFPRDVGRALAGRYDLIIIGAGIYGMTLALEAARRGLKPLLIDKNDFGGATSLNSLRILHGGLRYLQHLDMPRVLESIEQRAWFMRHFAPLCRALPCIMPLYGKGLKRPFVFRLALAVNGLVAKDLPEGKVLSREEVIARFPLVQQDGLKGGALWYDGQILSPQRLHAELLRWAADSGAAALNYVEPLELKHRGGQVSGLVTNVGEFKAPVVINAAGPWCREVAKRLDIDQPELITPSLTYNVLLNVPSPSQAAVAVQGSRVYFVTPHRAGLSFIGTVHCPWEGKREPDSAMLDEFLSDLNQAIPGWNVTRANIIRTTPGVLPCKSPQNPEMAHRSVFIRHEVKGLFSICGIKYTTAQRFAVRTIEQIFGPLLARSNMPAFGKRTTFVDPCVIAQLKEDEFRALLTEEAVTCSDDLLERRIDWVRDEDMRAELQSRVESVLDQRVSTCE